MQIKKLQALYENDILKMRVKSESPQTLPAPTKPSTKPSTTPGTPTKPLKPADPFFPKPGQTPRPKAVMEDDEENLEQEPVTTKTETSNSSLERFLAKRTQYKQ